MAKITITPESLRNRASSLGNQNQTHRDTYSRINSLIQNLVSEWTGEAQTAFLMAFEGNKPTFEKFGTDIDSFVKLMNDAANRMEQTDQDLKSKMAI